MVTYPSHTTMLTGVWPDKHGIHSNETFDPYARTSVVSRFPTAALPALNVFTGASEWTHVLARGGSRKFQDHA